MTDPAVTRAHWGWWPPILGGMGLLALLAHSDRVWAAWSRRVPVAAPRAVYRAVWGGAALTHLYKSARAGEAVARAGLGRRAAVGYAGQALLLGEPALRLARAAGPPPERAMTVAAARSLTG